jgi:acyl-[acyl-carrier-protein] desaturase
MSIEDALQTEYVGFFHKAERERRWSVFEDVPWDRQPRPTPAEGERFVRELLLVKSALAHALGSGSLVVEGSNATDEFRCAWRFEESRHRLALGDWLRRGRTDLPAPPDSVRTAGCPEWATAAVSPRERTALGYLVEMLTFTACSSRGVRGLGELDPCLRRILDFIARDDIAHARYFEAALRLLSREDPSGTGADLVAAGAMLVAAAPLLDATELDDRVVAPALARLGFTRDDKATPGPKKAREAETTRQLAGRRS